MSEPSAQHERISRIQLHHRAMGTDQPWTRERFYRLCKCLECVPDELAALFCVTPQMLSGWLNRDRIPAYWALHLALLEQAFWRAKYGAAGLPIVPAHEILHENENQKER